MHNTIVGVILYNRSPVISPGRVLLALLWACGLCCCAPNTVVIVSVEGLDLSPDVFTLVATARYGNETRSMTFQKQDHFAVELPPDTTGTLTLDVAGDAAAGCTLLTGTLEVPLMPSNAVNATLPMKSTPLALTGATPAIGPSSGHVSVELSGANIMQGATVSFAGVVATQVRIVPPCQIVAVLPAKPDALGRVPVTVTLPDGRSAFSDGLFSYYLDTFDFGPQPLSPIPDKQGPRAIDAGDLNGDGKLDLAVADTSGGQVRILLGNGDGTFQVAQTLTGADFPDTVTMSDLNGNGKLDIVVAEFDYGSVFVYMGNGDGTFKAPRISPTGEQHSHAVATGDVNRDGIVDLVVAHQFDTRVLIGKGDGTFQLLATTIPIGSPEDAHAIALGDVNSDKRLDLIIAGYGELSVLFGDGTGGFQSAPKSVPVSDDYPGGVILADVNNDGQLDLVVGGNQHLNVLLGKGDGTFRTSSSLDGFGQVAVKDVDGDGNLDVVDVSGSGGNVWIGKGDGTFTSSSTFSSSGNPYGMVLGDLNGDGLPDLAIANLLDNNVNLLLGDGAGYFEPKKIIVAPLGKEKNPQSMAVGDVDMDGNLDLVVANTWGNSVSVLLGKGNGALHPAMDVAAVFMSPMAVVMGDLDGDGRLDLAVGNNPSGNANGLTLSVLHGNGDGTFKPRSTIPIPDGARYLAIGDIDHDGKQDVVVASYLGAINVLLGNGDGTFRPARNVLKNSATSLLYDFSLVDITGDGILDLIVPDYDSNKLKILVGNGDGTFQVMSSTSPVLPNPSKIAVGDVNGDHVPDLVAVNNEVWTVSILLGRGDGTFQDALKILPITGDLDITANYDALALKDVNGDGKLDLIVLDGGSEGLGGNVQILRGQGDGTFQPAQTIPMTGLPQCLVVGDMNGDSKPDLNIANSQNNTVTVLLNNSR